MIKNIQQKALILASQSPRRKYLLEQAGLVFEVVPSYFDEHSVAPKSPTDHVDTLARAKSEQIARQFPNHWVIGADTVVCINHNVLGKPKDPTDAKSMLKRLSGQTHQVYTGFCICCTQLKQRISDVVCTDVTFKKLSDIEIEWYAHTDEPFDKAGAYAIQGLGTFLVKHINGSYTNVVGLPVCEVIEILIEQGVIHLNNGPKHAA